jgi:glycosyltransferase involved in cell wall biosynthesis
MKILLVHNRYQIPGGEEVVFEQERQLLERAGHQVLTYCRTNFEADTYTGMRRMNLVKNIAWSDDTKQELAHLLRDEKPQIVHVHNTFMMMSPSVFAACREAGVPVVQTLHNYRLFCPAANFVRNGKPCEECVEHTLLRGIQYGCYRQSRAATATVALMLQIQRKRDMFADLHVALTDFSRNKFIACGIPADKVSVKPNFVYPDPQARTEAGSHAVVVGRLSEEKGLHTLLIAWKRLRTRIPLSIVGEGSLLQQLQQKVSGLKLSGVTFHGRLTHDKTLQMIKSARFLIVPSECYENFPMGIAEAFACGVPVLCSDLGGMREIVAEGRTGLRFAAGNSIDLATKVEWAWSHQPEMAAMGTNARREYQAKYTAEKNYPLLMEIYRRAAATQATESPVETEMSFSFSQG